jgi:hypothetical protein
MTSEITDAGEAVGARIISRILEDDSAFAEAIVTGAGSDMAGDAGRGAAADAGPALAGGAAGDPAALAGAGGDPAASGGGPLGTGGDPGAGGPAATGGDPGLGAPIPPPQEGQPVWRVWGQNEAADGTLLPSGSRPWGESWTPADPTASPDFRAGAGLPDQNPGRFYTRGILVKPGNVYDVRPALPLDGQPGGWPEYLIRDPQSAIEPTHVGGVNEPWSHLPGEWTPPPPKGGP